MSRSFAGVNILGGRAFSLPDLHPKKFKAVRGSLPTLQYAFQLLSTHKKTLKLPGFLPFVTLRVFPGPTSL